MQTTEIEFNVILSGLIIKFCICLSVVQLNQFVMYLLFTNIENNYLATCIYYVKPSPTGEQVCESKQFMPLVVVYGRLAMLWSLSAVPAICGGAYLTNSITCALPGSLAA